MHAARVDWGGLLSAPRRWLRRAGLALGALALLLVLALALTWGYLHSASGQERLRALAVDGANGALAGRLELSGLALEGTRLVLVGVALFDPEGNLVAQVDRLEAQLAPWGLLSSQLDVTALRLFGVRLFLVQDERGLNLSRAVASKKPSAPSKDNAALRVRVREARAEGVELDFRAPGQALEHARLRGGALMAGASYDSSDGALEARALLTANVLAPLEGPLRLAATAGGRGEALWAQLMLDLGDSRLAARWTHDGPAADAVELSELSLTAAVGKAVAPSWPLRVTARAQGKLGRKGDVADADLLLDAGKARLKVSARADLRAQTVSPLSVDGQSIDLSELFDQAPASDLSLTLLARGGGERLSSLEGSVLLDVPASRVRGQSVGPIRLSATAHPGQVKLEELRAELPGVKLTGAGGGTLEALDLRARIVATDLSLLGRMLAGMGVVAGAGLSGSGQLELALRGPAEHPGLLAKSTLARLGVGDVRADGLLANVEVPDLARAVEANGQLSAARVTLLGRTRDDDTVFEQLSATVETKGRNLRADLSTAGLSRLSFHAAGLLDANAAGLSLDELALRYPEAEWTLVQPSHARWSDGGFVLEPVELRAGEQRLSAAVTRRGPRIDAAVDVERLQLAKLPAALVSPKLRLAGQVFAHLRAQGRSATPDVDASLRLEGGALQGLQGIAVTASGTLRAGRAQATLTARAPVGELAAKLDVPLSALDRADDSPLLASVQVPRLDLAALSTALERGDLPLAGTLALDASLTGTAQHPELSASARSAPLAWAVVDQGQLKLDELHGSLALAGDLAGAKLELAGLGGSLRVEATLPVPTRAALLGRLDAGALRSAPLSARLEVEAISLEPLAAAGLLPEQTRGRVEARGKAQGSLNKPELTAQGAVRALATPDLAPTDAHLEVSATPAAVSLSVRAERGPKVLARVEARASAPLEQLLSELGRATAPLSATIDVGPLQLSQVAPPAPDAPADRLDGVLVAHAALEGNLASPRAVGRATLSQLGVGSLAVGQAELTAEYRGGNARGQAKLLSPGGGDLEAKGEVGIDLSYGALGREVLWSRAPMTAQLSAHRFDLAFLSGGLSTVRELGGRLDADARLRGTVGAPRLAGALEWSDGKLALDGQGEYRRVHLKVDGTDESFRLTELVASSGAGSLKVTGAGTRRDERLLLSATATAHSFPIVSDDQVFAIATLNATLEGEASRQLLDIRRLTIPSARFELPEVKKKDLQDLDRPADIVLVRNGRPLKPLQKKRAAGESQREGFVLRAVLDAPKNLWLKSSDLNLELGLSDGFRVEYTDQTFLSGEVRVLRGKAEVIGRRFDVSPESSLRFAGAAKTPYINILATHANEREGVTVHVAITGRGKDIVLRPTSEPPLTESEIYTLLATGRRTLKRGSGAAITGAQAASVVGALAAAQLKSALAKKLPLDVFSIEAGEEGLSGTQVEAGTYLSDKLYLGYTGRLGADPSKGENSHAGRLEYQVAPHWNVEAYFGDARAGGADLVWTVEY